jgi:hypothetical protein
MNFESVPPHSSDAENRLLGSMLIDPVAADIAIETLKSEHFYVPKYRTLFKFCSAFYLQNRTLEELSVEAAMKKDGILESIGGQGTIGQIILNTPSAAGVEEYADIILKRYADRECLKHAQALYQAALKGAGHETLEALGLTNGHTQFTQNTIEALVHYDTDHDPNTLIGRRWLCRSQAALIIGQSGLGKSSLTMQFIISMALGIDFFGMTPVRPLKILSIQAENDTGDQAEHLKGVLNGLNLNNRIADLNKMITFISETVRTGDQFISWISALARRHSPDIIAIDPILSYIGGDISSQEVCSKFFRNGLNPISQHTGCAWLVVHHTGKPPKDTQVRSFMRSGDMSYLGLGSSELTNWSRAILNLTQSDSGYTLFASKRGDRSNFTAEDSTSTREVFLRHGSHGICWERANAPVNQKQTEIDGLVERCLEEMTLNKCYQRVDIRKIVESISGCASKTIYKEYSIPYKVWCQLQLKTASPLYTGIYIKQ